jgi:hypothetical protein
VNKLTYFIPALLLCVAGGDVGYADDTDTMQRAFVEHYVAALRSQDSVQLKDLVHPASRACISPETRDYFDFMFAKDLSYGAALRGGYSLTHFGPLDSDAETASELGGMLPNPVKPTHQFQIDTPFDGNNRSLAILRMAAEHAGSWFIVLGCPTPKAVEFFRERRAEGERQRARARQLADALHEPLLTEIRNLLAQRRRVEAVKRYQREANVDLTTASQVVDTLNAK